jgi:hypothetical protein
MYERVRERRIKREEKRVREVGEGGLWCVP